MPGVRLRAAARSALADLDAHHYRRRLPDPLLLDRLHGRRPRLRALLRLHEFLRLRDADAGALRQLRRTARRLGPGRPRVVLPHRLLVRAAARPSPPRAKRSSSTSSATSASCSRSSCSLPPIRLGRVRRRVRRGRTLGNAAALRRSASRSSSAAAAKSAQVPLHTWLARRDGRPDPGLRADPRRDDGHRRRLPHRALRAAVERRADARMLVGTIGALTALAGAILGCAQWDIKRILAYSTMSQIGYMIMGVGRRRVRRRRRALLHARVLQSATLPRRRDRSSTRSPTSRTCAAWAACARRCRSRFGRC